jgi:nucleoside 2-deoxyribosyltransferase
MFQQPIKIYIASKMRHAQKFMELRDDYPDLIFTARWPQYAALASEAQRPVYEWMGNNFSDILNADVVVVYAEKGEELKGALVEIGYAIAARKPIVVVGEHRSYSKWQFNQIHCIRTPKLDQAMKEIRIMFRGKKETIWRGLGTGTLP